MPPRVMNGNQAGLGLSAWYTDIPPITRYYLSAVFASTLCIRFGVISPAWLVLHWQSITRNLELWRLLTPMCVLGGFSIKTVIQMVWIYQYGSSLERSAYAINPADYALFFLFVNAVLLAASFLLPSYFGFAILGPPIAFAILHLYSRHNAEQAVSIMGLIKIRSFYLPFAFAALEMLMGGDVMPAVGGILAAHLFYWLNDLYPRATGSAPLRSPAWLQRLLAGWGIGTYRPSPPPRRAGAAPAPAPTTASAGFRAFGGQGRRLAD